MPILQQILISAREYIHILSILYAIQTGDCVLYVESIRHFLLWTLTYNRQNYARYLTLYLKEIFNLEELQIYL